jgi:hypothetical protein
MKLSSLFSVILGIAILTFVMGSCKKSDSTPPVTTQPTLYDSLGGTTLVSDPATSGATIEKGRLLIRNIIDSTIFVIAADTIINHYFTTLLTEVGAGNLTGFEALSKNLTDFVAVGTGAKDYTYTGLSMTVAHNPGTSPTGNPRINEKVDNADFTQFEVDLFAGANKAGVPSTTPALVSVGNIVESLRTTVVQR